MILEDKSGYIAVGRVLKAVGLNGLCSVELFGTTLWEINLPFGVLLGNDLCSLQKVEISLLKQRNKSIVCQFSDTNDRTAAEAFRGMLMHIRHEQLPSLGEEEYYHFELQGMVVISQSGERIGVVESVFNYPSTDALEIRLFNGGNVTAPFLPNCVLKVDKGNRQIVINKEFLEEFF